MTRAVLIVLDSFGCGGAPDAEAFGDRGADTLGHIAQACAEGRGDRPGLRAGPLRLPRLEALGLGEAGFASTGRRPAGFAPITPEGPHGCAVESAPGKDTPSGHWELAGAGPTEPFGYFPMTTPSFPPALIEALCRETGLDGILGDRHAAGVDIIEDLGEDSLRSGRPICYTSVDSVFQIAAHEEAFGLERLYAVCAVARRLCDPLRIGRIIARPFLGASRADFRRTPHRRDFAMPPPHGNLLDRAAESGRAVLSFGKIADIFCHRHVGRAVKGASDAALMRALAQEWPGLPDGGLAFVNLVECDTDFGHRRDVAGYAAALEAFDAQLAAFETLLRPGDLLLFTADHGNDPTWRGANHTRENTPLLCWGPGDDERLAPRSLGPRRFADIGAGLARWLDLAPTAEGRSFLG